MSAEILSTQIIHHKGEDMRTEVDLLGSKEISDECYYGVHTQRAMENFNISNQTLSDMPEIVRGLALTKKAVALANKTLRVIEPHKADAIVTACDLILNEGRCLDQFPIDVFQGGAGTSSNMNANEVIANLALEVLGEAKGRYDIINPNNDVNLSQSTNDAYPSALRLGFYEKMQSLLTALTYLRDGLAIKAAEYQDVLKMGRTQLQDAVPMSVGQEFNAFAAMLNAEIKALSIAADDLLTFNLGATAIGSGINTPAHYPETVVKHLSELMGKPCRSAEDLFSATYDCSDLVTLHAGLKRCAIRLGKICNDLRLLTSGPRTALKEINLPELQAGSSIMPAKVNPVLPEVINQLCFKVMGNDVTVSLAADAAQLQLNVMEPVIVQAMYESMSLLHNGCHNLRDRCIDGITVNTDRCRDFVLNSIGIITYLNPVIGHAEGDIVGKICAQTGKSIKEVVLERGLMTEAELDELLSEENLLHPHHVAPKF
ncbi:aspartate ammonia-lyase [Wohlfahrtiimonas chitiniclastica]|uniref:aspartate ammonia-lyase n=1 Tax=Wohlfahrtiimonas chitiniclastica TaxID=400946 RepID=UPI001BCA8ED5|nr:aspartate ammonia-lyase [Wohlfahrtiimonas chitiniclastica]MBS7814283.1 aspartate ammonia-lyase [Wohlfahrtiimonas chitiniclastica]